MNTIYKRQLFNFKYIDIEANKLYNGSHMFADFES